MNNSSLEFRAACTRMGVSYGGGNPVGSLLGKKVQQINSGNGNGNPGNGINLRNMGKVSLNSGRVNNAAQEGENVTAGGSNSGSGHVMVYEQKQVCPGKIDGESNSRRSGYLDDYKSELSRSLDDLYLSSRDDLYPGQPMQNGASSSWTQVPSEKLLVSAELMFEKEAMSPGSMHPAFPVLPGVMQNNAKLDHDYSDLFEVKPLADAMRQGSLATSFLEIPVVTVTVNENPVLDEKKDEANEARRGRSPSAPSVLVTSPAVTSTAVKSPAVTPPAVTPPAVTPPAVTPEMQNVPLDNNSPSPSPGATDCSPQQSSSPQLSVPSSSKEKPKFFSKLIRSFSLNNSLK
ncbi:hypothetical protein QS306_14245 [Paraburkholderia bonniea]|uniref:hypothetical protein n=1 Tax=Paraburkholderia bonniea TaxID=2152891 RepID=UPI002573312E|nr:hypothetical protein [Paraburkholderia bonniea]WJF91931.1 hypothetical protein QS306_14245 [Paraburkholderia bonniea]WJF95250.1 hypothetical protein QS308_14250 [Paraburkholderia bonniea]